MRSQPESAARGLPSGIHRNLPVLITPRLRIRLGSTEDIAEIIQFYQANEEHFAPWSPPLPGGFYSPVYWRERIRLGIEEFRLGISIRLFIFRQHSVSGARLSRGELVGTLSFTQLYRGPFQACYLGYALSKTAEGQGYMGEALRASIDYVFQEHGIHRIMANYMPQNVRSGKLLKRLGFTAEGLARDYLLIQGEWRDHVLTSLVNSEWRADPSRS